MPVTVRRLAIAGILTATAVAVPIAALAGNNATGKAPTSTASAPVPRAAKSKPAESGVPLSAVAARLASRLGVSTSAAQHAVAQLQAGVSAAQIAHELGVSTERLNTALRAVKMSFAPPASSGAPAGGAKKPAQRGRDLTTLRAAAAALASRLGVSMSAAQDALHQLGVISARQGGLESNSPQFRAIAHRLGVSPARLDAALRAVKESLAGR